MYPNWPEVEITCRATRAGAECTASTTYGKVKLSATSTEADETKARNKAKRALEKKVRQRKAYEL